MASQTKHWQSSVLDAANRENDLSRLYWFIEMRIPPQSRSKRFADGHCPAAWPEAHVPVIPVGNEPESSRAVADFLAAMVRANNPRIMEASPALCDAESLATAGCAWYVYGETEFDTICYACGAVGRVIHYAAGDGWLCEVCSAEHEP